MADTHEDMGKQGHCWPENLYIYMADQGGHYVLIYSSLPDEYHSHNQFKCWLIMNLAHGT